MSAVLALDQGTTSSRALVFSRDGTTLGVAQQEFAQHFPQPGWVEHDPADLWETTRRVATAAVAEANLAASNLVAVGLTNQRETTLLWDRKTGRPLAPAIVWQDRRTAAMCRLLQRRGLEPLVRRKTGLILDPYFSGTKLAWLLDHVPGARRRAQRGELAFGTVDTWLLWQLTGGRVHATDVTNASRTLLFDLRTGQWDDALLRALRIPVEVLPEIRASSGHFGEITSIPALKGLPITGVAGDQHAALFGQACFKAGMVKATYGTGGSLLMNTGDTPIPSERGLLTTVGWGVNDRVEYALEGLLFIVGASVQWLRDEIKLVHSAEDTEYYASKVKDTNGVYFVPAFVGLSAPYWDQYARGAILGLTRGANRNHIIRACLESIAYQIRDVIECMEKDSGIRNTELKVDGGACKNNFLMQFQADLLGVPVLRPKIVETTARGAAFLAGLATGFWRDQDELVDTFELDRRFEPTIDQAQRDELYAGWQKAVERTMDWEKH